MTAIAFAILFLAAAHGEAHDKDAASGQEGYATFYTFCFVAILLLSANDLLLSANDVAHMWLRP